MKCQIRYYKQKINSLINYKKNIQFINLRRKELVHCLLSDSVDKMPIR